jgi:hypothetical protein
MSQSGQKMDYYKEAKAGVSIKGQKMVILVYIYEASSQTLSLQQIEKYFWNST